VEIIAKVVITKYFSSQIKAWKRYRRATL